MGQATDGIVHGSAEGADEAGGVRPRRRGRDLLSQDDPQGHLRAVGGTGHATAGERDDERCQDGVGTEGLLGRFRVGVEVEQPAASGDGSTHVTHVGQP